MYQTFVGGSGITSDTTLENLVFSSNLWFADDFDVIVGDADETYIEKPDDRDQCHVTGVVVINLNVLMSQVLGLPDYECEHWLNENRQNVDVFLSTRYGCKRTGNWEYEELVFERVMPKTTPLSKVAELLDETGGVTNLVRDIYRQDENLAVKINSYVEGTL